MRRINDHQTCGNADVESSDVTWNPVTVSSGGAAGSAGRTAGRAGMAPNCSASAASHRGGQTKEVRCHPERLDQPLGWSRPRRILVNAVADLFHEAVPFEFIDEVFSTMARGKQHTYHLTTRWPDRMLAYMQSGKAASAIDGYVDWGWGEGAWPLPNVRLGVCAESGRHGARRAAQPRGAPAALGVRRRGPPASTGATGS